MHKRVALVTGAASGIGLAAAQSLVAAGYQVVMSDLNQQQGQEEAKKISACFIQADLFNQVDCKRLVAATAEKYGSVDVLVNNAGLQHVCPIESFPIEIWDRIIAVMLTAPFLLTQYVWPYMKNNNWGRIINLNSVHGLRASEFKVAYVSAKHGMTGLTKTTALEGAPFGITVNDVCPGYVRTPLVDGQVEAQAKSHGISKEKVLTQILLKKQAIKQMVETDDLGAAILYLCSDAARCMTGTSFTIDCGWSAQ